MRDLNEYIAREANKEDGAQVVSRKANLSLKRY